MKECDALTLKDTLPQVAGLGKAVFPRFSMVCQYTDAQSGILQRSWSPPHTIWQEAQDSNNWVTVSKIQKVL